MAPVLPTITGKVDREVEQAIKILAQGLATGDAATNRIAQYLQKNPPLTLEQIRAALSATGTTPLNITQLLGGGSGAGTSRVGTHTQRLALSLSTLAAGSIFCETDRFAVYGVTSAKQWQLILAWMRETTANRPADLTLTDVNFWFVDSTFGDAVYRWTGTQWNWSFGVRLDTNANRPSTNLDTGVIFSTSDRGYQTYRWSGANWVLMEGIGGPMRGTLSPNTKPSLGSNDTGFLFFAGDYDRVYRWNGSAWDDAPGQPTRFQVSAFDTGGPVPATGWFLCDGSTVSQSNADGTLSNYTTRDLVTNPLFQRFNSSAGGTSTTSTPTATGTPSAATQVDNNLDASTVFVGSSGHTHSIGAITPPYFDFLPYVRL